MKRIVCLLFFLVSFFDVLFAQEGIYVVTRKAGEIPVYNSDNEVIGTLKRGDRVFVTLFHKELLQVDGSYSEPFTFIEYEGQEGHLLLGSADWLKCEEPFVVDSETRAAQEAAQSRPGGIIALLVLANVLLLFFVAQPRNIFMWEVRDRLRNRSMALLFGLLAVALFAFEGYGIYWLADPVWFSRWQHVGLWGMLGGLLVLLLVVYVKMTLIAGISSALAGMQRSNRLYFDYRTAFLVVFVGTWAVLVLDSWKGNWIPGAQWGIVLAVVGVVCYKMRHVFRQRHLFSALMILLVMLTGIPVLCYVSLEAFSRVLEIVMWIYIIVCVIQGLGSKGFKAVYSEDDIVDYYDYREGQYRKLYKDNTGAYVDYSDGSRWGPIDGGRDFNRF